MDVKKGNLKLGETTEGEVARVKPGWKYYNEEAE